MRTGPEDGTSTRTRAGTDWGRVGALWTIAGVFVAVVAIVVPLMVGGGGSGSSGGTSTTSPVSTTTTAPSPTTADQTSRPSDSDAGSTALAPTVPADRASTPGSGSAPGPARSGPALSVSPAAVTRGGDMVIRGSGFAPLTGLHIRWFRPDSISYELGRNVPVDEDGTFAAGGPMENPGFCGAGVIAVFTESGSSYAVPDFDEALATAPVVMRC